MLHELHNAIMFYDVYFLPTIYLCGFVEHSVSAKDIQYTPSTHPAWFKRSRHDTVIYRKSRCRLLERFPSLESNRWGSKFYEAVRLLNRPRNKVESACFVADLFAKDKDLKDSLWRHRSSQAVLLKRGLVTSCQTFSKQSFSRTVSYLLFFAWKDSWLCQVPCEINLIV